MMQRLEASGVAVELAGEAPIIGAVGNSTFDLVPFDRPQNFYMWNSMGMASSIGLGLALARPDLRVVILDGDGSLLMNLSSLATEQACGASNLVHVVWDNGGWEITGGQPAGSTIRRRSRGRRARLRFSQDLDRRGRRRLQRRLRPGDGGRPGLAHRRPRGAR